MNKTLLDPKQEPLIKDPLPGLVKELKEAHAELPDEQIDEVAKHSIDRFENARIREFVPVLAWRHARFHMRKAIQSPTRARVGSATAGSS